MTDEDMPTWEAIAREAVAEDLRGRSNDVEAALFDLAETFQFGEEPTPDQVLNARRALDQARRVLEDRVVPVVDGVEPWDRPIMCMPYGAVREHYNLVEEGADE